jgi:hypothetical protein
VEEGFTFLNFKIGNLLSGNFPAEVPTAVPVLGVENEMI